MAASFSLLEMDALAPGLSEREAWLSWAQSGLWPVAPMPATPAIPAMTARRLSQDARLALQLALPLIQTWQPSRLLCVSRHGELARTFTLLQQLVAQQPLSPTDFSMSVHNTVAGLLTIVGEVALPAASLAAGANSFQAGLLEACATLSVESGRILLLYFEGQLPAFYGSWQPEHEPAHALALVLEAGEQWRYLGSEATEPTEGNQALSFWRQHLLGQASIRLPGRRSPLWSCAAS